MTDILLIILCTIGVLAVMLLIGLTHLAIVEKNQRDRLSGRLFFPRDDYEK